MPSNYIKRLVQLAHKPISLPHHMAVCSMLRYLEQQRTNSGAASLPDNACTVVRRWWTKLVGNGRVRSVWCPGSSWSSNIRMSWRSVSATVEQWWGRHGVGRRVNSTQWRPVVDFEQRSRTCFVFLKLKKTSFLAFFEMTCQIVVSKSSVLNPRKWDHDFAEWSQQQTYRSSSFPSSLSVTRAKKLS